jgi:protein arginine kinase activator
MLCEKCQKNQATVHLQQFVNGVKTEMHLCPACSLSLAEMPISFENLFQGVLDSILSMSKPHAETDSKLAPPSGRKCPVCGITYEQFKSTGKLGCEECYRTFSGELETLLKNVQGSVRHEGKFPKRSGVAMRQKRETDRLKMMLKKAVEDENFEEAANLRDRIRSMEVTV